MDQRLASLEIDEKRALLAEVLRKRAVQLRRAPLSMAQQRIWQVLQLAPGSPVYNIGFAYDLKGLLNVEALERALDALTRRHEALRTGFEVADGIPMQVIAPELKARLERIDLTGINEADFPVASRQVAQERVRAPIDLALPPLWHFTLLERSERDNVFLITTHHIISDRWSVGLLVKDLAIAYSAFARGAPSPLGEPALSYSEATRQIEESIPERVVAEQLAYWQFQFEGDIGGLILPADGARSHEAGYCGQRLNFSLGEELSAKVNALAASERVTVYVILLAALAGRLHGDTRQSTLVFVTPVSGRHHSATRGVIGYFNNLLPIKLTVAPASSFRDLLGAAAAVVKGAFENQEAAFQLIAAQPGLARINLARCLVSVQNTTSLALELPEIASSYDDVPSGTANFDLAVFLEQVSGKYRGWIDAKTDLWSADHCERFSERLLSLLETLVDHPETPLDEFLDVAPSGIFPPHSEKKHASHAAHPLEGQPTASEAAGQVRNELERRIIDIWQEVTGWRDLGPESHFFALGGNSLMAARLFERIGRAIGREVPLAALLQAPTVRQLSQLISDGDLAPFWAALVPIQPKGSRSPLFCVHGGGGGVLAYAKIAEHMGADQPLWGLQAPKRDGNSAPQRVEETARLYCEAVLSEWPEGPYHLCGHSFGGLLAFEMARQLSAQGKPVDSLIVIDYPGPDARITWIDKLRWNIYSLAQLNHRQKIAYIVDRLKWKARQRPVLYRTLGKAADFLFRTRKHSTAAEHRLKTVTETLTAMELYRPGSYPGRLTLFRARAGDAAINLDPLGGWGSAALGGVEVQDFRCDHMEIFSEPYCQDLSAALRGILDRSLPQ
jgi:thioesterase domain-containing protein